MPSLNYINVLSKINKYCRGYAVEFFQNMNGNTILTMLAAWIESIQGGAPSVVIASTLELTSANFINATDCPLVALNGMNILVFDNDASRFLKKSAGEWSDLPGGGFKVLLPGFDATANTYNFYVTLKG